MYIATILQYYIFCSKENFFSILLPRTKHCILLRLDIEKGKEMKAIAKKRKVLWPILYGVTVADKIFYLL